MRVELVAVALDRARPLAQARVPGLGVGAEGLLARTDRLAAILAVDDLRPLLDRVLQAAVDGLEAELALSVSERDLVLARARAVDAAVALDLGPARCNACLPLLSRASTWSSVKPKPSSFQSPATMYLSSGMRAYSW